jgi:hypothetical protein
MTVEFSEARISSGGRKSATCACRCSSVFAALYSRSEHSSYSAMMSCCVRIVCSERPPDPVDASKEFITDPAARKAAYSFAFRSRMRSKRNQDQFVRDLWLGR